MTSLEDALRIADLQGDELEALEKLARRSALGPLERKLDDLMKRSHAAMALTPSAYEQVLDALLELFAGLADRADAVVTSAMLDAYGMGLRHAADQVTLEKPLDLPWTPTPPSVGQAVREQLAAAQAMMTSNEMVVPSLMVAKKALTRVDAAVTWHVQASHSAGITRSAEELGFSRRWVAERDACLHCLAYQGEVADIGQDFRAGLTFDKRPLTTLPVPDPPLHPHDRCQIQLHDPRDTEVITALKREAKRSVLRGTALPSESEASRLRAADRLLAKGAGLPVSVEKRAKKAVERGRF